MLKTTFVKKMNTDANLWQIRTHWYLNTGTRQETAQITYDVFKQ